MMPIRKRELRQITKNVPRSNPSKLKLRDAFRQYTVVCDLPALDYRRWKKLPQHLTREQAKSLVKTALQGEPVESVNLILGNIVRFKEKLSTRLRRWESFMKLLEKTDNVGLWASILTIGTATISGLVASVSGLTLAGIWVSHEPVSLSLLLCTVLSTTVTFLSAVANVLVVKVWSLNEPPERLNTLYHRLDDFLQMAREVLAEKGAELKPVQA